MQQATFIYGSSSLTVLAQALSVLPGHRPQAIRAAQIAPALATKIVCTAAALSLLLVTRRTASAQVVVVLAGLTTVGWAPRRSRAGLTVLVEGVDASKPGDGEKKP